MNSRKDTKLYLWLAYAIGAILVLLPFHAFFTTWAGSNFGHLDLFRIWKELLLVPIGLVSLWLLYKDQQSFKWLKRTGLFYLILGYIGLHILLGALAFAHHRVNASALIYALLSNLRPVIFFVICLAVAARSNWLFRHWKQLILIPAAIVVVFALLQHFVLQPDFLRHFGYGPHTIPAYQAVDQKSAYARLQSTLRGPNPLGAYLVLIITMLLAMVIKETRRRLWRTVAMIASLTVLFYTYSRSALLGVLTSGFIVAWRSFKQPKLKRYLLIASAALVLIGAGGIFALRNNDRVQNTFFHTDEHSRSADSSNQDRAAALKSGVHDIVHEPWGRGPGTAGPASVRNPYNTRIAENYYLQIGQEVGILGLFVFVAINFLVAVSLWRRKDVLSVALFASLIGLTVVNMLSHAWSDDTLSLLWWGLAGIALGNAILETNSEHEKAQKKPAKRNN